MNDLAWVRESRMSTPRNCTRSPNSWWAATRRGISSWQGGHHSPQKLTTTGVPFSCASSRWKVSGSIAGRASANSGSSGSFGGIAGGDRPDRSARLRPRGRRKPRARARRGERAVVGRSYKDGRTLHGIARLSLGARARHPGPARGPKAGHPPDRPPGKGRGGPRGPRRHGHPYGRAISSATTRAATSTARQWSGSATCGSGKRRP